MKKTVDKRYAKSEGYKKVLSEIEKAKVCPFCPEHFKWHTKPVLKERGNWLITSSFQPYENSEWHLLLLSKVHKENFNELKPSDFSNLSYLVNWAVKKFKLKGGGLCMRFGDTLHTGATVCHIHAHLIVPKVVRGKSKPVWFPIG